MSLSMFLFLVVIVFISIRLLLFLTVPIIWGVILSGLVIMFSGNISIEAVGVLFAIGFVIGLSLMEHDLKKNFVNKEDERRYLEIMEELKRMSRN